MAVTCARYNQTISTACRNSQPGIKYIWLCNYSDVTAYQISGSDIVSGITMSGGTYFYRVAVNKQVASVMDNAVVKVQEGISICKPTLSFKIQGFQTEVRKMYEQLMQATVIAVVQTIDGLYYILGLTNGLDATEISYGTEAGAEGFKGLTVKLEGLEPKPYYEMQLSNFSTLVAS